MFNLYNEFLKYEYNELQELFKMARSKEEQDFYMHYVTLNYRKNKRKLLEMILKWS